MTIELNWPDGAPATEYSKPFLQGMLDRLATSWVKYGAMADGYPKKVDAIESALMRLIRYAGVERFKAAAKTALEALESPMTHRRPDGNLEYLMDTSNFLLIEFQHPRLPDAHFKAEDSSASPGRSWHTGHVGQDGNTHRNEANRRSSLYAKDGD